MGPIYALALASGAWTHPGAAPCGYGADNPCWTPALAPAAIIEARAAGEFHPSEICDGDIIRNTGARDGVAFETGVQVASFDPDWLGAQGLRYRTTESGRSCIPTIAAGAWHEPEACGNRTILIRRADDAPLAPIAAGRFGSLRAAAARGAASFRRVETPLPAVSLPWSGLMLLSAVATLLFHGRRT